MKVTVVVDPSSEREVIIKAPEYDDEVAKIRAAVDSASADGEIALRSGQSEVFVKRSEIYFFEVSDDKTYAHTARDCFTTPLRLLELEGILPGTFCRASKSVLVNAMKIRSMTRSPTGVGEASFSGSEKKIYISRMYYKAVRDVIEEVRLKK